MAHAGFNDNLTLGGPVPVGARKANLSNEVQMHMEEVALNEQGHALFTRQVGAQWRSSVGFQATKHGMLGGHAVLVHSCNCCVCGCT